jgi:hypothetical protein
LLIQKLYSAIRAVYDGLLGMLGMKRKGKKSKLGNLRNPAKEVVIADEQRPPFWNYATPGRKPVIPQYKRE